MQMRDSYDADLLKLNMSADPKGSAAYINDWVSRRTRGKIANIMADSLPPDTHLVAANAVYLKAAWAKPFDPKSTDDEDFYVSAERVERVPTMFSRCSPSLLLLLDGTWPFPVHRCQDGR